MANEIDNIQQKEVEKVLTESPKQEEDNQVLDGNEEEIPVSEMKGKTFGQKICMKLTDDFLSRKFLILVISVVAFFTVPKHFTADHLVITFGIYAGANVLDKLVNWKSGNKNFSGNGN